MPSIDERVVAMSFENAVFEQRVAQTMATLGKLDSAIKNIGTTSGLSNIERDASKVTLQAPMSAFDKLKSKLSGAGQGAAEGFNAIESAANKVGLTGPFGAIDKLKAKFGQLSAGSTFTDIEKAADRVELSGLTRALDNVTGKFSVLQGAASVALGGITAQAASKGASFAKSFAFGPLQQGLGEYQTNLGSIQTILANTQGQQVSGLGATQSALGDLNTYSDKTIYNFSEMAKNIGTFTAAGVDLPKSVSSIKGIANLAALSGSNSQQASTAMYQLSQAIASGRVGLQDWNSVVNAGMGGAVFQKSLMRTAENMGALKKGAVDIDKATGKATVNGQSFRESIMAKPGEQSWLTSDVLTSTLGQLTGDMTDAELAAKGFTTEQIKAIQAQAKSASAAATEVKTLPQVFDVARETIGSGWSTTFQNIFGNFTESKKTFTEMSNFVNGFINRTSNARNKMLGEWKKLGGRDELIGGIKQAFANLGAILAPIKEAFRDIFPAKTGKDLFEMTKNFHSLMENLKPSPELIDQLRRIFGGLFSIMHIGWTITKGLVGVFLDLIGAAGKGSGGFLGFVAGIGDFLKSVDEAVTKGGALKSFFDGLGTVLKQPVELIKKLVSALAGLFGDGKPKKVDQLIELNQFGRILTPAERLVNKFKDAWDKLVNAFNNTKSALEPWFSSFVDKLSGIGKVIGDALSKISLDDVLKGVQTGLLAGLLVTIRQAFGKGGGFLEALKKPLEGFSGVMKGFTGNLEAMQGKVKAEAILAIAGAVAVLAGGIYILSTIDGDKLQKAMLAVAVGLGELMGAMKLMTSGMGKLGVLQMPVIAAGMIGLAIAVTILAGAMKIFATMSWEDIGKGLVGVAGSISAVAGAMRLMPANLPLTAAGLILIGIALNLIGAAVKIFASLKWEELGKGLFGVIEALGGIALGVSMMPPNLPLTAAGLILMGIALGLIGSAIGKMGAMDFMTIIKGLGTMMAAIAGIGVALWLMPPNIALQAVGLAVLGGALILIGKSLEIMGGMGVFAIVKGLIAMAGALLIIGAGLIFMEGTLPGAAALMMAALALAVLGPTLAFLGTLKWGTIFKGLAAMALVLGTLAIVGALAAEPLAMLGIALLPLAGVFVLAAAGVFLFAKGLALLGETGGKGIAVMVTAVTAFVALIPKLVVDFIKGMLNAIGQLAELAPKVVIALGVIIDTVIAFIITSAPKLAIAIGVLVDSIIQVLVTNAPKLIAAGYKLLNDLLNGISQNIGQVTTKVAQIIQKFLTALAAKTQDLVNAGMKVLLNFLQGITNNIPKVVEKVAGMVTAFIKALTEQVPKIIHAGQDLMIKLIGAISDYVPKLITKGAEIITKFLDGIEQAIPKIKTKALAVARAFLTNLADGIVELADIVFKAFINLLNGLAETIRNNDDELINAGTNLGSAIGEGLLKGFGRMGGLIRSALEKVFQLLPGWAKKILGIKSPSSIFMEIGRFTMLGFKKGIEDSAPEVRKPVKEIFGTGSNGFVGMIRSVLGIHSPSEVMREVGKQVNQGFKEGLMGSVGDVRSAFQSLNEKLRENIRSAKETIVSEQAKLDDLLKEKKPDWEAIAEAKKAIAENEALLSKSRSARQELIVGMKSEKAQLIGLKKDYEQVTKGLEEAEQKLQDITQKRDAFRDKFMGTPDISGLLSDAMANADLSDAERREKDRKAQEEAEKRRKIDQVAAYKKALEEQLKATKLYNETLEKLKAAGLDDTTYQKLLDMGTAGQEFASQLLAGGTQAISGINALDAQVAEAATTLANNATMKLYNTGVAAAQALVDGLKARKGVLEDQMKDLAKAMVRAIKRELKIKSPSKIFLEMGQLTMAGLAQGLSSGGADAEKSLSDTADQLVATAQGKFSKVPEILDGLMDMDPTITPVLDLSQVEQGAKTLGDLTNVTPIAAAASFNQASAISAAQPGAAVDAAAQAGQAGSSFQFNQYNTSPESLSEVEIYRQTKNQFSQLKKLVGVQ